MSSRQLFRLGGLALLVGGLLNAITIALGSFQEPNDPLQLPTNAVAIFAILLALLGFSALYARLSHSTGVLGLVGYALLFSAGALLALGGSVFGLLTPSIMKNAPTLFNSGPPPEMQTYFMVGGIVELIGGLAFAAAIIRAAAPERMAALLLILGTLVSFVGNVFVPFVPHLGDLGTVFVTLSLAWMGWTLMTRHAPQEEPSMAPEGTRGMGARA